MNNRIKKLAPKRDLTFSRENDSVEPDWMPGGRGSAEGNGSSAREARFGMLPLFAAVYERQKSRGKPHSVALFYVARKLVEVMCGMHKTGRPFSLQTAGGAICL